ncbi:LysM domain-containing protein [Paludibacter sp. 221]|uniref:LysM peptidoglycan-binding domain-containing protein n=1 Tax=Paludibacter sp. 221 TaxID=2302939 RepID=UPI0013D46D59|nr:LysM domain-containing protein [Paludibacter sp. 221]NDV45513.1 LysM domain-containing protein [Paludibacter sp. 221]
MIITVQQGQTLFDIAVQHCGDAQAVIPIAQANDISITGELVAGTSLAIPEPLNKRIVNYYKINNIVPATAITGTPGDSRIFDSTFDNTFE